MMNKKGSLVLRDVVFMMMIISGIFIFAGLFVSEMALNYENTNMSNEWVISGTNTIANSTFYSTGSNITATGASLNEESTGIWSLISGALDGAGAVLYMVLNAPATIGTLVSGVLVDMGVVSTTVAIPIKYIIMILLWVVIIFTIISAFLQGGKL